MATKQEVIAAHRKHKAWGPSEIADHLGCSSGYVRATAQREGLILPRSPNKPRTAARDSIQALGVAARTAGLTVKAIQLITIDTKTALENGDSR